MKRHHLRASVEPCHWGFFDATLKPVLTVASGDEVTIDTISGGPDMIPPDPSFTSRPSCGTFTRAASAWCPATF